MFGKEQNKNRREKERKRRREEKKEKRGRKKGRRKEKSLTLWILKKQRFGTIEVILLVLERG